jgi:methylmalonyl-CoA/ethylmalonyl-CoA epimerase
MSLVKRLAHIGLAVRNLDATLEIWRDKLGFTLEEIEELKSEGLRIAHLRTPDGVAIELITASSPESAVNKFIAKKGEGLHHLCFEVDDIQRVENELASQGISFLPGYPRPGSRQTIIAFVHPRSLGGVLIEFAQKRKKRE